jgi:ATP phosphoribosyltransferase
LPVNDIEELKKFISDSYKNRYFRIASEYAYIADHYALTHRLNKYQVIMTYGATESLIPEDAEMIIENTETGSTLRKNRLRIIDTLFASEGCLIANTNSLEAPEKGNIIRKLETLMNYPEQQAAAYQKEKIDT